MWIALNTSDFWNFCREQRIFLKGSIEIFEYPNMTNTEIWIEVDERYSKLSKRFNGPIFLSHIKKVVPFTHNAKDSIKQLLATFPNLINYVRM